MAIPLFLAACATEQERCISQQTREYRVVSNLLAEVQGNLDRGYAWEEREVIRPVYRMCRDVIRDRDGNRRIIERGCWEDRWDTERYRVPIDPDVETRKRDNLVARKAALEPRARAGIAACRATYPENG
ncbi:MAG: hypothetical protein Q4G22_04000 [Paracoccus sp. (in: a-proteobacteria)]|uniref:hypothetical protein n=1 Tax=Paracoccus sp. TaxID=267 RepID=UPI0026E05403|nr:hypothetical protein [Paracoccus sp. (in: a-proteobacteria)]MDO5630980.1 hypothetical protein [Paracoccus sp. (in: a-proteobacteria)]